MPNASEDASVSAIIAAVLKITHKEAGKRLRILPPENRMSTASRMNALQQALGVGRL